MKGLYAMDAASRIAAFSSPEPTSGCWLWMHSMYSNGYGNIAFRGVRKLAHRLSYEAHVGPIPDGMDLDHLCRTRSCVNPRHLEPVSRETNIRRSSLVGRNGGARQTQKTHCPQGHEYTAENTTVRSGKRYCRTCRRDRERNKYREQRRNAA